MSYYKTYSGLIYGIIAFMLTLSQSYLSSPVHAHEKVAMSEDSRLMEFFEKEWSNYLDNQPEFKTLLGIKDEDYGQWNNRSDTFQIKMYEQHKTNLVYLQKNFDYNKLSPQKKVSYDFYKQQLESTVENHNYRFHNFVLDHESGQITELFVFLQNNHQIDNLEDAHYFLQRLSGLQEIIDQFRINSQMRADKGIMVPAFSYKIIISSINNLVKGQPIDDSIKTNPLYQNFNDKLNKLTLSDKVQQELLTTASKHLKKGVKPAIAQLVEELKRQQSLQKNNHGAWSLPDGEAYYENSIKQHTTLTLTAEEVHQTGLKEVARIHSEMRSIMKTVKFEGSLQEFFDFMKKYPANYYPNTEAGRNAFIKDTKEQSNKVFAIADQYFHRLPKADFEVRRVEPWREKTTGIAFYNQPSMDGSRPGIYYANLVDMTKVQKYPFVSVGYHEGVPGHHFQIALAQEIEGVPSFQKFLSNTAYIEGWALYAEFLAKEMGFFKKPYQDFGRLQEELWRAIRLVVDTGLHAKKWSREKAIEYGAKNCPYDMADIIQEIERFMVWPGQAVSYKVGMIKIQELRNKSKQELGNKFDIRDFHSIILDNGSVPLSVLEKQVQLFIQNKLSNK